MAFSKDTRIKKKLASKVRTFLQHTSLGIFEERIIIIIYFLNSGSLTNGQQSISGISKDPASYREEFFKESNRQEMVKTLERQVSDSSVGQWNHRQRQEGDQERDSVSQPPVPPPAPPPPPPMKRDPPTFFIPPPPTEPPPPIPTSVTPPFSIEIPLTNGNPPMNNGIPNGVASPTTLAKVKFQL